MITYHNIKTDYEIFETPRIKGVSNSRVSVVYVKRTQLLDYFDAIIYMKSSLFVLVLNGSIDLDINFKQYAVKKDAIVLLSFGHFLNIKCISNEFECIMLYVGKEYIDEMYSTNMIYKRVKYGVKMHSIPLLTLTEENALLLGKRLSFVDDTINSKNHLYYNEMILHTLEIFFLDLGNIIEHETSNNDDQNTSRDELYFQKFIELLVDHYKKEHLVDFYANNLHITSHYLTLIIKRLSGQTVSDVIFQLLYSEAKILLQKQELSIQQIAITLSFSDQSAFGKFFKRKGGISPREYRAKNQFVTEIKDSGVL